MLVMLLACTSLLAQQAQPFKYYKSLMQSGAPTATVCYDGTMVYDYTAKIDYICRSNAWQRNAVPRLTATTSGYILDFNGLTASTADIRFTNSATFGQLVSGTSTYVGNYKPSARPSTDFAYYFGINDNGSSSSGLMTGGAAQKTYGLFVNLNRPAASAATGDSNDAAVKVTINNYAGNDTNFIQRGINVVSNNRTTGTLGKLEGGLISASCKSGTTCPDVWGAEINTENFGTNATSQIGLDVTIKNEGAKATTQAGIRIRDLNNSIAGPSDAAILVAEPTVASTGFNYVIDANGTDSPTHAFVRMQNGAIIYFGTQTTRNAVRTEVGTGGAIGSFYVSTAGKMYLKVATGGADTDWERVTTSAAD